MGWGVAGLTALLRKCVCVCTRGVFAVDFYAAWLGDWYAFCDRYFGSVHMTLVYRATV